LQSVPRAGVASTLFDKGLIFIEERDVLLAGKKWTLVVNVALDNYEFKLRYETYISTSSEERRFI
jgi:hypothetical protein